MLHLIAGLKLPAPLPTFRCVLFLFGALAIVQPGRAQDTPLISGGVAFLTETNGGNTSYVPDLEPLLAAPIGQHILVESRAEILEFFSPKGGDQPGYSHSHYIALAYLQGDFLVSRHITLVAGDYLIPFNTYNERLSPVWIGNFQDDPLIVPLGTFAGSGLGGQFRGNAIERNKFSIDYAWFYSVPSSNEQFIASRGTGGRVSLYLPNQRLEVGVSYDRLLQGTHENFLGAHVWWEPKDTAFRLRSEFGRGQHAEGYWVEADYRTQAFGGLDSPIGRIEPVVRMQQTFSRDNFAGNDGLPSVNTQRADFGLNYNLPHNTRILTSYARQFSAASNRNIWETGIVYHFFTPAWKGK
jgi:hypothetical protein